MSSYPGDKLEKLEKPWFNEDKNFIQFIQTVASQCIGNSWEMFVRFTALYDATTLNLKTTYDLINYNDAYAAFT